MNVAIRADGSPAIGMGHIMRCLSLAKAFRQSGHKVVFLSKFEQGIQKIREESFDLIQLSGYFIEPSKDVFTYVSLPELRAEINEVGNALGILESDVLVVDSYNVSKEYFLQLESRVKKICYIDDVNRFAICAAILVNGNITGEYLNYKKYYEDGLLLLGPRYNLIRDEFENLPPRTIEKEVREIMLTTGGGDPCQTSIHILEMILSDVLLKELTVHVIVGGGFFNKDRLYEVAGSNENIVLHENVRCMSELMLRSDLAISSGGSTLYELCACGTPVLAFIMAENQEEITRLMHRRGYVISLGWSYQLKQEDFSAAMRSLMQNYTLRQDMSHKGRNLVDAKGAKRVVAAIDNLISKCQV